MMRCRPGGPREERVGFRTNEGKMTAAIGGWMAECRTFGRGRTVDGGG